MGSRQTRFKVNKPHKKEFLTTPFGRFIDVISYTKLAVITLLVWVCSTAYFSIATYYGHGMNIVTDCLETIDVVFTAMYFSGVTVTTLGYGDISPLGGGRIVSVLLAVSGLTLVAILIAKVSSERQSSLLLLLHTSDVERRMSSFAGEVDQYIKEIKTNLESEDRDVLHNKIKGLRTLVESINKFMIFHINQSLFIEIGTNASIKKLMSKFSECHDVIYGIRDIAKDNKKIELASYSVSKKMSFIEDMLVANNEQKGIKSESFSSGKLRGKHDEFTYWKKTTMTEALLSNVHEKLPKVPRQDWKKHIHKDIAKELEISNKLVIKCIDELKQRNLC